MATTLTALRRQIDSATDLKAVVRTMKASAASAIGQYENSVAALADYARTVELGLGVCLRAADLRGSPTPSLPPPLPSSPANTLVHAVVFGSDQGLVGRFNEQVVEHAVTALAQTRSRVWTVGERAQARLVDAGITPEGSFVVPGSVELITRLVGQILQEVQTPVGADEAETQHTALILYYNRPTAHGYAPVSQQLLPMDAHWQHQLANRAWPTPQRSTQTMPHLSTQTMPQISTQTMPQPLTQMPQLPEALDPSAQTLRAFIHEHLFVSLFRACAESLASENASRLAAMQRADRNIGELLEELHTRFHRLRQAGIGEELFDVIAGFDALK
jgi:F-type H+-transporting ATPase subunit gamma